MLMAGTLLAAASANRDVTQAPLSILILAVGLITVGGLLTMASGSRILVRPSFSGAVVPLEAFGVSGQALGFSSQVIASESLPAGYRPTYFKGSIEIDAPVGDWKVLEEYSTDAGWYRVA